MSRNIGIKVKMPETEPDQNDKKNPFNAVSYTHLTLPTSDLV